MNFTLCKDGKICWLFENWKTLQLRNAFSHQWNWIWCSFVLWANPYDSHYVPELCFSITARREQLCVCVCVVHSCLSTACPHGLCLFPAERNGQSVTAGFGWDDSFWKKDGRQEESLHLREGRWKVTRHPVLAALKEGRTFARAVTFFFGATLRLLAGNRSLSEESAKILLERGLVPVEGGACLSVSSLLRFCLMCWRCNRFFLSQGLCSPETFGLIW